jgi:hypothetical protein
LCTERFTAEIESACRLRAGEFDAAARVAEAAIAACERASPGSAADRARVQATRATLAQNAASALMSAGAFAAAARGFDRTAANELESGNAGAAVLARVQALTAAWRAGDPEPRLAQIDAHLSAPHVPDAALAEAAWLFLDHADAARAAPLVERLERHTTAAAGLLRGRLAGARGDFAAARSAFAAAERDYVRGREGRFGLYVARILTSWSELEERAGDVASATWHAYRAVFHLEDTGQPAELHAALCRLIRLERLRLEFGSVLANAVRRERLGLPSTMPGADEAVHGPLRAQLETGLAATLDAAQRERVIAACGAAFPGGPAREYACGLARALFLDDPESAAALVAPESAPRFAPLADVAALLARRDELEPAAFVEAALTLARRQPSDEP